PQQVCHLVPFHSRPATMPPGSPAQSFPEALSMAPVERALALLLRLEGAVLLLALPFVFLPTAWMAAAHVWLGLGPFPDSPLTEYLTRSLSGLYALWGPLYLF